ncbi:MAG: zinc-binding dehydrogenase, partial [Acidimicrobiia bacterium]|nr:zinc-binding dehydrogenase [Acidimicrobiia bacterium]
VILDIAATRSPRRFQPILADGGRYVHLARSLAGFFRAAAIGAVTNRWKNSRTSNFAWKANNPDDLAEMAELVGSRAVAPFIGGRYELADLPEALRRHGAGEVDGKILISVDGD